MKYKKLLLIGGGGHCKSVIDVLNAINDYDEISIIDIKEKFGDKVLGRSVVGNDDDLQKFYSQGYKFAFITVGGIGASKLRKNLYNKVKCIGFSQISIIDPSAVVSEYARIGQNVFVGKKAVINAEAIIGDSAIINTASIIEHECVIGSFAHIAPGAVLCGQVTIGEETHIGANSVVKEGIIIGSKSVIGMGSVVVRDVGSGVTTFGNPIKEVKGL